MLRPPPEVFVVGRVGRGAEDVQLGAACGQAVERIDEDVDALVADEGAEETEAHGLVPPACSEPCG